jgi:hypothetical protein
MARYFLAGIDNARAITHDSVKDSAHVRKVGAP